MTLEEFQRRFKGRMLLFVVEAWSIRKAKPSEQGLLMDEHDTQARQLLADIYRCFHPEPKPTQPARPPQPRSSA